MNADGFHSELEIIEDEVFYSCFLYFYAAH